MKKILVLPLIFSLYGCACVPVPITVKFPEAPETLMEKCSALKEATEGMTLSEYTKTVVDNYVLYHECERKVEGWHEWYTTQKTIFETATKK